MRLIDVDNIKICATGLVDENGKVLLLEEDVWASIDRTPTADAVPMEAYNQVAWERDCAMKQLEEHGIPFGGKADVVPVVRCKDCHWHDMRGYEETNRDKESGLEFGYCRHWKQETQACEFCSYGERREENADN